MPNCRITSESFVVSPLERELCKKFKVPLPTVHPKERIRKLASFANYTGLFHGKCAATGEKLLQIFPPEVSFPVYHNSYWWSDQHDVFKIWQEYDFTKAFFPQFHALAKTVPYPALSVTYEGLENCDYINGASFCKNCYLIFHAANDEDCLFCFNIWRCVDCIDCTAIFDSTLCYDCTLVNDCYDLRHSFNCKNCSESAFLWNCISCNNCFGCVNLRQKKFCYFNTQLSEEDYREKMQAIEWDNFDAIEKLRLEFIDFAKTQAQPSIHGVSIYNSTGDFLSNCKNAFDCFDGRELEDCVNCMRVEQVKSSMDYFCWGADSELIYSASRCGYNCNNIKFCNIVWMNCSDLEYCIHCFNCQNCFACAGLRNAKYCILNKQYSKDEYFSLKARIISQMKDPKINHGENAYGEFFPYYMTQFPYLSSDAGIYFPLPKEEIERRGAWWREDDISSIQKTKSFEELPTRSIDVSESILKESFSCISSGKTFRISSKELADYKRRRIPIPQQHWRTRLLNRHELIRSSELHRRKCEKSGKDILTTYSPDSPWIVWDHEVYAREVN